MLFVHARTNSVVVQLHTIFLAVLIAAGVAFVATSPACIPPILHPQMTPRPVQHGGGVELVPVLHSIRTAVKCFALEPTAEVASSRRNSAS